MITGFEALLRRVMDTIAASWLVVAFLSILAWAAVIAACYAVFY